jgi:hypothetical protein
MRRDVAFTGGAALAAGLLIGFIVDRLPRFFPSAAPARPEPASPAGSGGARADVSTRADGGPVTDVLERYRVAAAI